MIKKLVIVFEGFSRCGKLPENMKQWGEKVESLCGTHFKQEEEGV